jgi:hypothetical protein
VESLLRQACLAGARECVAISAINPKSIRPLLERAGEILARDLTEGAGDETRSEGDETKNETDGAVDAFAESESGAGEAEPEEFETATQSRK